MADELFHWHGLLTEDEAHYLSSLSPQAKATLDKALTAQVDVQTSALHEQLATLQAEFATLSQRNHDLEQLFHASRAPTAPGAPASSPALGHYDIASAPRNDIMDLGYETHHPDTRGTKIPLPEKFGGKKADSALFLFQLNRAFLAMPHRYPTDEAKITAATNLLTGKATNFIRPYAEQTELPLFLTSWAAFQAKFRSQFIDPDQIATKTQLLNALNQTGPAQDYANSFDNIVAYLDLSEQSKRQRFFTGLKARVQERILDPLDTELFPTYASLVDKAIRYDNLLHNHFTHQSNTTAAPTSGRSKNISTTSHTKSSNASTQQSRYQPSSSPSNVTASTHEPMDVDAIKIPKTTAEKAAQRAYRMANGLCTCCGAKGHFIKECPKATKYRARQVNNISSSTSAPTTTSSGKANTQ